MKGFEWRYLAAGLGWGLAVGTVSGILVLWAAILIAFVASPEPLDGLLGGLFWMGVIGGYFGLIAGAAAGPLVGGVLSVLNGRESREQVASWVAVGVCVIATPLLTWAAFEVLRGGVDRLSLLSPWTWLVLGVPTVLSALAMSWSARRIARRNAAEPVKV